MNIEVCVGNSCYSKGSCDVIKGFQRLIQKNHLNKVTVSASFGMGQCAHQGVSVKIDEKSIEGVSLNNLEKVFIRYVLKPVACSSKYDEYVESCG